VHSTARGRGGREEGVFFPRQKDPMYSRSEEAASAFISVAHVGEIDEIHCHQLPSVELLETPIDYLYQ